VSTTCASRAEHVSSSVSCVENCMFLHVLQRVERVLSAYASRA
jgi:hypothetical protein